MEQAIHAGSDAIFASYAKLQERPEIKHQKSQKEKLALLANSDNWKAITEVIDAYITQLKSLPGTNIANDTVEAVGFRYLASQIAIEYLEDVRDLPARAKKATTKDENKT